MGAVTVLLEPGPRAFFPGGTVRGDVAWEDGDGHREVVVSLLWFTQGKGTEDIWIAQQRRFDVANAAGREPFSFDLPASPWSFSGRLVSLHWAVEASLEPGGGVDRVEITVGPGAQEVRL